MSAHGEVSPLALAAHRALREPLLARRVPVVDRRGGVGPRVHRAQADAPGGGVGPRGAGGSVPPAEGSGMTHGSPAGLEADYRRKKAEIREDPGLSWEQKERQVKALGEEHHARMKEREQGAGAA